jgi:hypothetical protein
MDETDKSAINYLKNINKIYKNEIEEEIELERKYDLMHTAKDIKRRKQSGEMQILSLKQRRIPHYKGLLKHSNDLENITKLQRKTINEYDYYKY